MDQKSVSALSSPAPEGSLAVNLTIGQLRELIREATIAGLKAGEPEDRLLSVDDAAKLLDVSTDWIYRNAKRLPFARKLGPKMLKFSYKGMLQWMASRKAA